MRRKAADKQLSRRVLVNIDQDLTTKTSKVIWEHEIPLLEQVHGEGKVIIQDAKILDEGFTDKPDRTLSPHTPLGDVQDKIARPSESARIGWAFTGDVDQEYERLKAVYGVKHDEEEDRNVSVVFLAYGRPNDNRLAELLGQPELSDLPDTQLRYVLQSQGQAIPDGATREELLTLAADASVEMA